MSAELEALLRQMGADPSALHALTPEADRALAASLRAALGAEEPSAAAGPVPTVAPAAWGADDLLTAPEAAAMLKISPRWLYRHAKTLPFARKLSKKVLRFSRAGIARWLATKRP